MCIGEVTQGSQFFDHSWIEIDGKVFDIAIQLKYNEDTNPPVYASHDLYTEEPVNRIYGTRSPVAFAKYSGWFLLYLEIL